MDNFQFFCASVAVIGTFASIAALIVKPINRLNTTNAKLNTSLENIVEEIKSFKLTNKESHDHLWDKNQKQDDTLDDHEKRLTVIETEHLMKKENCHD